MASGDIDSFQLLLLAIERSLHILREPCGARSVADQIDDLITSVDAVLTVDSGFNHANSPRSSDEEGRQDPETESEDATPPECDDDPILQDSPNSGNPPDATSYPPEHQPESRRQHVALQDRGTRFNPNLCFDHLPDLTQGVIFEIIRRVLAFSIKVPPFRARFLPYLPLHTGKLLQTSNEPNLKLNVGDIAHWALPSKLISEQRKANSVEGKRSQWLSRDTLVLVSREGNYNIGDPLVLRHRKYETRIEESCRRAGIIGPLRSRILRLRRAFCERTAEGPVNHLAFGNGQSDGLLFVSADGRTNMETERANLSILDLRHRTLIKVKGHRGRHSVLNTVNTGPFFTSIASDFQIRTWDAASFQLQGVLSFPNQHKAQYITALRQAIFAPSLMAAGSSAGAVEVVFVNEQGQSMSNTILSEVSDPRNISPVTDVRFGKHLSGNVLFVAHDYNDAEQFSLRRDALNRVDLWDSTSGRYITRLPGCDLPVSCIAVASCGFLVASGTFHGSVGTVASICRGKRYPGYVHVHDVRSHEAGAIDTEPRLFSPCSVGRDDVKAVTFSPDDIYMTATTSENETRMWDVRFPYRPLAILKQACNANSHRPNLIEGGASPLWTPDGLFVAGSVSGTVNLWDPRRPGDDGAELLVHSYCVSEDPITAIALDGENRSLAVGTSRGEVALLSRSRELAYRFKSRPSLIEL